MSSLHALTITFGGRKLKNTGWMMISLLFHALIVFWVLWQKSEDILSEEPPAAIMVQWSESPEAPLSPDNTPVGLARQQSAEMMEVGGEKEQTEVLPVKDALITLDTAQKKKPKKDGKKQPRLQEQQLVQSSDARSDATVSNASPFSHKKSSRVAAPFNSDSANPRAQVSWESLVKGHLNRFKNYPVDARRRGRTGVASVTFIVDAGGRVSGVVLKSSSGTRSLDREAIDVIERAHPLPKPPAELLTGGEHITTIPISFSLSELSSR